MDVSRQADCFVTRATYHQSCQQDVQTFTVQGDRINQQGVPVGAVPIQGLALLTMETSHGLGIARPAYTPLGIPVVCQPLLTPPRTISRLFGSLSEHEFRDPVLA